MEKVDKAMRIVAHVLEIVLSVIVLIAVIVGLVFLYEPFIAFAKSKGDSALFMEFLGQVLAIAIGLEFFRVLYKPQIKVLLEVLVFVIARHMIVYDLSAVNELIAIVGIAIIVVVRYFFGEGNHRKKNEVKE